MKQKLFDPTLSPACAYCAHGRPAPDGESVLCVKKGVMRKDSACRKYRYDPLKRTPKKKPRLPQYNAEEFEL